MWRVKLNGKMSLKSFCLWDFAESLWNVNLWLLEDIFSHVLRKDIASLRSWAMEQAVPQSQWLVGEATTSQSCRCKGFPHGFAYNPFPLLANEYWRKGFYLERFCISSTAREKWCALVRVLWLEKASLHRSENSCCVLGDADIQILPHLGGGALRLLST